MNVYKVKEGHRLRFDDRLYEPGETVEIDPHTAGPLVESGVLEEGESAVVLEQALDVLRLATGDEVRGFFQRMNDDEAIAAKMEEEPDRQSKLITAIDCLEEGNENHWTKSGKPEVRALEELTGLKSISAAERDAAWETHEAKEAAE